MADENSILMTPGVAASIPAQLGISIEPVDQVYAQVNQLQARSPTKASVGALVKSVDPVQLLTKVLESECNFSDVFQRNISHSANAIVGRFL